MKRRLKAPSPALVISLSALFVALGGTTYAATSLPKDSVGTRQLKNGAVTKTKISKKTLVALKGNRGPAGATGPTGLPGSTGSQGPQGLLGPTSGATAGDVEAESSAGFTPVGSSGTVTLPATGKVLVEVSGSFLVTCTPAGGCSYTVSAFVDGTAVPGAHYTLNAPANGEDFDNIAVSGIALNVPAGTHTVQLETKPGPNVNVTNSENFHVTALALGNN